MTGRQQMEVRKGANQMADTRDIEASRPEFEAQMRAAGYRDDRHDTGEYVGVTSYRWEGWIAALASRPAEVDDEGLPHLPEPLPLDDHEARYSAEQYRQGQRDAVAAYKRADSFCEANCCWSGHHVDCFRSKEVEAPSHTTNKEK